MGKGRSMRAAGTQVGRPRSTMTVGGIQWQRSSRATRQNQTLISVSIAKLDRAWKKDSSYYIPRGTDPAGKVKNAKKILRAGKKVDAPEATYRKGVVSFTDGRSRTAAARDLGKKRMVISVAKSSAAQIAKALN